MELVPFLDILLTSTWKARDDFHFLLVKYCGVFETEANDTELSGKVYRKCKDMLNFLNANPSTENSGSTRSKITGNGNSG